MGNIENGPRIGIVGSEGSGRSSLMRILVNYAIKNEWRPLVADLDPQSFDLSLNGTLTIQAFEDYIGYGIIEGNKLSFFFGFWSLEKRAQVYLQQLHMMQQIVNEQLQKERDSFLKYIQQGAFQQKSDDGIKLKNEFLKKDCFPSGIFYKLPSELQNLSEDQIRYMMDITNIDYIIVIGNDSLKSQLEGILDQSEVSIIRMTSNTGIQVMDINERKRVVQAHMLNYFGSEKVMFVREHISFSDIMLVQLEAGEEREGGIPNISIIDPRITFDLAGKLIGLINLQKSDDLGIEDIWRAHILSLALIVDIDRKGIVIKRNQKLPSDYTKFVFMIGGVKI